MTVDRQSATWWLAIVAFSMTSVCTAAVAQTSLPNHPEAFEITESRVELLRPSNEWWGWAARAHGEDRGRIGNLFVGKDGHLYAYEFWGKGESAGGAIVDTFSGEELTSKADVPDIEKPAREAALGLERISPVIFPDPPLWNSGERLGCGRPNVQRLSKEMLDENGIYLYRFLPAPITYDGDSLCEESWGLFTDPAARTLDYESTGATVYRPLHDGTILLVVNHEWVVRLNPDLNSPFFAGRRDLIRVDSRAVDGAVKRYVPWGGDSQTQGQRAAQAIRAVRELLLEQADEQIRMR